MAFIAFDQVPNDAPVAARMMPAPAPVAAPARRRFRPPLALLAAALVLLWIGRAVSLAVDSVLLGIVAATLVFLVGVAARSAVQPVRARR